MLCQVVLVLLIFVCFVGVGWFSSFLWICVAMWRALTLKDLMLFKSPVSFLFPLFFGLSCAYTNDSCDPLFTCAVMHPMSVCVNLAESSNEWVGWRWVRKIGWVEVNQAVESMWCPCGEFVMSSWSRCRGILDVQWRCVGGVALWRQVEVNSGPAQLCLFPFFPSLSLPSKLPSCSLPFHSLSFFLFPPCQSPRFKTLSSQFSPPNMPFIPLFFALILPLFFPLSTHLL